MIFVEEDSVFCFIVGWSVRCAGIGWRSKRRDIDDLKNILGC